MSSAGPELILCQIARQEGNTKVTIYNGTDCKLYDVVREGELSDAEGVHCGTAVDRGEGEWNEWRSRCE